MSTCALKAAAVDLAAVVGDDFDLVVGGKGAAADVPAIAGAGLVSVDMHQQLTVLYARSAVPEALVKVLVHG